MKKVMILVACCGLVGMAVAQQRTNYWVVETQSATRGSVVRVYNELDELISETTVDRTIDVTSRREQKRLAKLVRQPNTNTMVVAKGKRKSRRAL